jgi:small subunit ribosomal protein S4
MATNRGRKTDICRKFGTCIWNAPKCPTRKRPYPTGQHGPNLRDRRTSEYAEQLLAKQVIRRYYDMLEKQFRNTFAKAQRMQGNASLNFLRLLELRLQTVVWRLGFAKTVFQARQMVSHGHIKVNGRVVNIPSFRLRVGDIVEVRDQDASRGIARRNHYEGAPVPAYLEPDIPQMRGTVVALPEREDFPSHFKEQQVVEFYAR